MPEPTVRLITEATALVSGSGAFLLSRLLRSPQVTTYMRSAGWLGGDDFNAALAAIHTAGRVWENTIKLPQRDNARANVRSPANPATMSIEDAAGLLGLSVRRTQELAQSGLLEGQRIGRRWILDEDSVRNYQHQHHHQKRAS
jgi:excisionase family DNA binding protein